MKFQKHDFEIMVDPKGTPNGTTFKFTFEDPDPLAPLWRTRQFFGQQIEKHMLVIICMRLC